MTNTNATELAAGMHALAAMVQAYPEAAEMTYLQYQFEKINVPVFEREHVAMIARAGLKSGATVTKHQNDDYAGVDVSFGPVALHVYMDRDKVCEKVVIGVEKVVKKVKDPKALAAVPEIEVEEEIEIVEWQCGSLLEDRADESVTA